MVTFSHFYSQMNESNSETEMGNTLKTQFVLSKIKYEVISETDKTVKIVRNEDVDYFGNIVIPLTVHFITDFKVVEIEERAFEGCDKITSIQFPDTITIIGKCAFYKCSALTSLELPKNLETIETGAFDHCKAVRSIKFPQGLISIDNLAFSYCLKLSNITLPSSLRSLGNYAFWHCCELTHVEIQGYQEFYLGKNIFSESGLKSIAFPRNIAIIGEYMFAGTSFEKIKLPDTVVIIKGHAFWSCRNLESVYLPDSVERIDDSAFSCCTNLREIRLSNSMVEIPAFMCESCCLIEYIDIPYSVKHISGGAFLNCKNLKKVRIPYETIFEEDRVFEKGVQIVRY